MVEMAKSMKVFVSYSRADVSFADQLVLALEDKGFEAILDRHDISGAENWRERLGKLILSADAVAFVLTAKSAASEICSWEVDAAVRLGKRIIPVTPGSIDGVTPPTALSELNWIPFYPDPAIPGAGFYYGVKRLVGALSIDLDWLRVQTRYSERALEWAKEKPEDLLLRGEALKEAEAWQARSPAGSHPPDLVREYLAASGDAEQHRQVAAKAQLQEREQALKTAEAAVADSRAAQHKLKRFTQWALGGGVALLLLAAIGNFFAVTTTLDANDRRAALFATAANRLSQQGEYQKAMLVALSGDPSARGGMIERLFRPDGNKATRAALTRAFAGDRLIRATPIPREATAMVALADGKHFVTFLTDGAVLTWDATTGERVPDAQSVKTPFLVDKAYALPGGDLLAVLWKEAGAELPALWSLRQKKIVLKFELDRQPEIETPRALGISPDGKFLAAGAGSFLVLWDVTKAKPIHMKQTELSGPSVIAVANDGEFVVAAAYDRTVSWMPEDDLVNGPVEDNKGYITALSVMGDEGVFAGLDTGQLGIINPSTARISDSQAVLAQDLSDSEGNGVASMGFSPDQLLFYMLTTRGRLKAVRTENSLDLDVVGAHNGIKHLVWLQSARAFATVSEDSIVRVWRAISGERSDVLRDQLGANTVEGITPSGIVYGFARDGVPFRVTPNIDAVEVIDTGSLSDPMAATSDGSSIVATGVGGLEVWRIAAKAVERTIPFSALGEGADSVRQVEFLPDNKRFLVVSNNYLATMWSLDSEAKVAGPVKLEYFGRAAVSPDGSWIATSLGGGDNGFDNGVSVDVLEQLQLGKRSALGIWSMTGGEPQRVYVNGDVTALSIHPDGQRIVFGLKDGAIGLLQKGETTPRRLFTGHKGRQVVRFAFHTNGNLMVSTGYDGAVRLWRLDEREPVETFETLSERTKFAAFDADGTHVIGADKQGLVRWAISPMVLAGVDDQMKLACGLLEQRGIEGFSRQDKLEMSFLDDIDDAPCVKLGYTKAKPQAPAPL